MAVFNPDVQQVAEPQFLNYFRPTEKPEVNKKAAIAISGIGQVTGDALKAGDQLESKMAQDETTDQIQRIRDQRVAELSTMNNSPTSPNQPSPIDGVYASADYRQNLPSPLRDIGKYVSTVQEARANGKQSDVYYDMLLDTKLKELRSKYPGYRNVIDRAASEASGKDIANAQITDLKADIDAKTAAAKEKANKIETQLLEGLKYDNGGAIYNSWKAGGISDESAVNWLAKQRNTEYNIQQQKSQLELYKAQGQSVTDYSNKLVTTAVNGKLSNYLTSLDTLTGSEKEAVEYVKGVNAGTVKVDPVHAQQMAQVLQGLKQKFVQSTYQQLASDPVFKDADPKTIKEAVNDASAYFDGQAGFISSDKMDMAHLAKTYTQAAIDNKESELFSGDGQISKYLMLLRTLTDAKVDPIYVQKAVTALIGDPKFNTAWNAWFSKQVMENVIPPEQAPTPIQQGVATPLSQRVDQAQRNDAPAEVHRRLTTFPTQILDPSLNDAQKSAIAKKTFSPANRGLISKYEDDGVDPITGLRVQGKYSIFQRWTSPDMSKELYRLGKVDPEVWDGYKRWSQETFGSELFGRDVQNLNQYEDMDRINVRWDGKKFIPYYQSTAPYHTPAIRGQVLSSFDNINRGVNSIVHIAETEKDKPEAFIMQTLINAGVNPGNPNKNSLPGKMLEALKTYAKPPEEPKEK